MTFPQNTPSIDQLINLPAGEIAQLPVELLAALQREIDAAALADAVRGHDPIKKYRPVVAEPCVLRCPLAAREAS